MKFQEKISNSRLFPGFLLIFRIQGYFQDILEFQEAAGTLLLNVPSQNDNVTYDD